MSRPPLKAITLWQPWASAIALGVKRRETRSWPIRYRGPLAIHASAHRHRGDLERLAADPTWLRVLAPLWANRDLEARIAALPFSAIVAIVDVSGCLPTDGLVAHPSFMSPDERALGNYAPGRFAWLLNNLRPLAAPIPCAGRQGIWTVKPSIASAAFDQVGG